MVRQTGNMRAARKKRRSFTHMMEERSGMLLRERLPKEWVVHGYAPDYGIDGAVEIFEFTDSTQAYAETLGESIFFQLKSCAATDIRTVSVPWRMNVEKGPYAPTDDSVDIEVVRYNFTDTDELVTIESMGAGTAVVLFLACLDDDRVFFLNLTDYIEKVLNPESPTWREQGSKTIHIPTANELSSVSPVAQLLLRIYAIRPKMMALFTKVHFQWAELDHGSRELEMQAWHDMALHFIELLLRYDVWTYDGWILLAHYRDQLERMRDVLIDRGPSTEAQLACLDFWYRLDALGRTFEEVVREWGLPTALGYSSSYP
jgi:hypothetical protein